LELKGIPEPMEAFAVVWEPLADEPVPDALTAGFQRAFVVGSILILAAGVIGLRATNTRGEAAQLVGDRVPEPATP
jgi:hypothetical protein